ncbi:hypothetical protein JVU11DRAFT_7291 [Chiua virens]|nr:hypothetical protein JVU11DRAFT_7291 [Chiua virens]
MAYPAIFYVRVVATIFEVLGLVLTTWRIYFRLKIGRFWWEDAWAAILLVTGVIWLIAWWIYLKSNDLTSIVAGWFNSIGFTCIVTLARTSILYSIIRIIHGRPRLLKFSYACVAFFAACWIILIVEKVVQCALDSTWHKVYTFGAPSCLQKASYTIFQFITDCIAVSILVAIPLHMLWRVKLPRRQRRMILSIFASSIVLAFGALFHLVGEILTIPIVITSGMHVKAALSIIVCNLLVVVTYTYRFLLRDGGGPTMTGSTEDTSNDDDFTTRARPTVAETTSSLTTIDFEISLTSLEMSVKTGSV